MSERARQFIASKQAERTKGEKVKKTKTKVKGKATKSRTTKASGKTGQQRIRLKGNKQSAAKQRRDLQLSAFPLGGGSRSNKPGTKLALGETYMSIGMSETARMSSETMLTLYRISKRY